MKTTRFRFVASLIVLVLTSGLAGCQYEAPLAEPQGLPLDVRVLGSWTLTQDEGKTPEKPEGMNIVEFSETEYLVDYWNGDGVRFYFAAYPVEVGATKCVQLKLVGGVGIKDFEKMNKYAVASYAFVDDELVITVLNDKLVDSGLKSSEEIRKAFLDHEGDAALFAEPGRFARQKE